MSQAGNFFTSGAFPPGSVVQTLEGNTGGPVGPDGTNNINVVGDGVGVTVTGSPGTNTLTISLVGGGGVVEEFDTDDGTALPVAGIINIVTDNASQQAGSSVLFSGLGNTVLLSVTDNNSNTIIGEGSGNATVSGELNTILGAFSGVALSMGDANTFIGEEVAPNITTGDFNVIIGSGSGTNYAANESSNIIIGSLIDGTIGEANVLTIGLATGTGDGELIESFIHGIRGITPAIADGLPVIIDSAGQLGTGGGGIFANSFPTDNGTAVPVAGVLTIKGDTALQHAGSTVGFSGIGNAVQLDVTDGNNNTIIGGESGNATITGQRNTALGHNSALQITSGTDNVMVGAQVAQNLETGSYNILLGTGSGALYNTSETSNIVIGAQAVGVTGESNVLRLGSGTGSGIGQLSKAFIYGIDGVNVGSTATVVTEVSNQLGTAVITAGTGITITPGANLITISSSGTSILDYTNVNTTPYVVFVTDDFLSVDSSGAPITVQLPNAATLGITYVIKDRTGSAGTNAITVTTVGGAVNIDGATTFVMNTNYQAISIIGNGTTYEIY